MKGLTHVVGSAGEGQGRGGGVLTVQRAATTWARKESFVEGIGSVDEQRQAGRAQPCCVQVQGESAQRLRSL